MNPVVIELDLIQYPSVEDCKEWIKSDGRYKGLLELKSFKLTKRTCTFMGNEKRKVWGWYAAVEAQMMKSERPNRYVYVMRDVGSDKWTEDDCPPLLPETRFKMNKKEEARQKRVIMARERSEAAKRKKKNLPGGVIFTPDSSKAVAPARKKRKTPEKPVKIEEPLSPLNIPLSPLTDKEMFQKLEDTASDLQKNS